jgi:tetratricopeptide (TPR) repeat protein
MAGQDCVSCHMPKVQHGSFKLVDHWIRAHPGPSAPHKPTRHRPLKRVFLRLIAVPDRALAGRITAELRAGGSFFDLARRHSLDASAPAGGYLGDMELSKLDGALAEAASGLAHGEVSPVIESRGKFLILARPPRDFRWNAVALVREATDLRARGQLAQAIPKLEEALRLNPHSAHALVLLGTAAGEAGDTRRAVAVLEQASLLHPSDPSAHYNLGIAYGAAGRAAEEIASYRRALDLEPDLVSGYLNLGAALYSAGVHDQAAAALERGLQVNPLAANLYLNLAMVRLAQGRTADAERVLALARAIDPRIVRPAN